MRLLHSRKRVFKSFDSESTPSYAILSHTWGAEEVTHDDMTAWIRDRKANRNLPDKKDFHKVDLCCSQANHDGLDWVWIDTCNIDKSSSSELSEAINSMFQWYRNAEICYVYLDDVSQKDFQRGSMCSDHLRLQALRSARWFYRGWTLQELVASEKIKFFCAVPGQEMWRFIGTKETEAANLSAITGIDQAVLENPDLLPSMSVARRMSWAAFRETTRPEDIAYCLLGVFQVNMPLLYGEGSKAFIRLQEEILKNTEDESLFAWTEQEVNKIIRNDGILANHPRAFSESSGIVSYASKLEPYAMTNRGLRIESRLIPLSVGHSGYRHTISCILHCRYESTFETSIGIALDLDASTGTYRRSSYKPLRPIRHDIAKSAQTRTIYIHKCGTFQTRAIRHCHLRVFPASEGFVLEAAFALNIELESSYRASFSDSSTTGTVYAPGQEKIPWDMKHRALIAPKPQYGYFSALRFSRAHSSVSHGDKPGFIALLMLPNEIDLSEDGPISGVFLTPLMKTPNRSELHLSIEGGLRKIASCEHTLQLGYGKVAARLTKENHFGDDLFALDITFHSTQTNDVDIQGSSPTLPEIRIFDPEDGDITVSVHGSLGLTSQSQVVENRGKKRPAEY